MTFVSLACAHEAGDAKGANEFVRQYMITHQFQNDAFRLYGCLFASGNKASAVYNSNNNQKFFLRYIKSVDSVIKGAPVAGMARVSDSITKLDHYNPVLLTLYSHVMLLGRSYIPCLNYILRAYELLPKDPLILLTIGIVYIHRAIQRQTTNRHLQIVQGFTFLLQYHEIRSSQGPYEAQEADYNMGRAFHMLGLPTLATSWYHKVLQYANLESDYDLRSQAVYNLSLIYTVSGNPRLARTIVDQNLIID